MASGPEAKRPPHMALAERALGGVEWDADMGRAFKTMMRNVMTCVLYTVLSLGANAVPSVAGPLEAKALIAAQSAGPMEKLIIHAAPVAVPKVELLDAADAPIAPGDWQGHWVMLNFWATWCAPCRTEMPALLRLQFALPELLVLPVATGRNPMPAISRFYDEAGVTALPILRDVTSDLAHQLGIIGLPVTLIVNPEGQEVARLIGGADWDAPETLVVLRALMAP